MLAPYACHTPTITPLFRIIIAHPGLAQIAFHDYINIDVSAKRGGRQ